MKDHIHFRYGNGWLTAALVVFLLLCFMALLRGQDYPPEPPVFAKETVRYQPTPSYAVLSPKASGQTNDGAMSTIIWDYSTPEPTAPKPVLQSPKAVSLIDGVPMALVLPSPPAPEVLQTCHFTCSYAGEWESQHYYTWEISWDPGYTLETSTDLKNWYVVQDDETWLSHNIVGYFIAELSENRYFRARPTNVQ